MFLSRLLTSISVVLSKASGEAAYLCLIELTKVESSLFISDNTILPSASAVVTSSLTIGWFKKNIDCSISAPAPTKNIAGLTT